MKTALLTTSLLAALAASSQAAVTFTGPTLSYDFNSYDGTSGPSGWDADGFSDGSGFTENRGTSEGGVGTAGTYAFEVGDGDFALGVQSGGSDFTPGYYQLQVTNSTGATITSWNVAFDSYVYNDQERANSFNFSYSTDGSNYTAVSAGSFTSGEAADASPAWVKQVAYSDTIAASVVDGGSFYLRWEGDDVSGSGSRDEFALDNVSVGAVPEPSALGFLGLGALGLLRRRR